MEGPHSAVILAALPVAALPVAALSPLSSGRRLPIHSLALDEDHKGQGLSRLRKES